MYRGAIIGLGNVAISGHLPGWRNNSEFKIVAGVDPAPDRRRLLARAVPEAMTYASIEELPRDLDFIDICTPPHIHFEAAVFALGHGWNVLCEKPLVLTGQQLDQVRQLAMETGRVLFTVHNWKFAPICRKIVEILRAGTLGEILHCAWNVLRAGPSITAGLENWRLDSRRSGGGILIDHGWHAFYLVLEWFGARPVGVQASLENRQYVELDVEDTAIIKVRFEGANGRSPTADIFLTWASRFRGNSGVIEGSLARLTIEDDTLRLEGRDGSRAEFKFRSGLSEGSHHPDWFEFVAREFSRELTDASCRGANLDIARWCLRLVERSKASDQANGFLPL